jgi:hypothetical protein
MNKITTQGYFIKRLRDNGYNVNRIFSDYNTHDCRRWTVMINPGVDSLFITCVFNKEFHGQKYFEFNNSGQGINRNLIIETESMEIIIHKLREFSIKPTSTSNKYGTDKTKQHGKNV